MVIDSNGALSIDPICIDEQLTAGLGAALRSLSCDELSGSS
jgi:hypothetical protein